MKTLSYCGSLAAGLYLASFASACASAWPLLALVPILAVLFGYGYGLRGWRHVSMALLGAVLFLRAAASDEALYRERPWLRGCDRQTRRAVPDANGLSARLKRDISDRIRLGRETDRETVSLERAILLGEKRGIPRRLKRLFVESGTMHVFAISGLHVSAVAGLINLLLLLAFVPRRLCGVASVPLLWGYVALIGCPPSAVRAAAMATLSFAAPLLWRRPDGLRAWALTFLAVHLLDPLLIVNVGNILSFAVMLALVLAGEYAREWTKPRQALFATATAWAVGVPIAAHVFGRVTPGGMLANLVLLATAKLTVVAGAAGVVASALSDTLAAHLNNLSGLGIRLMVLVADAVSRLPGANLETGRWSLAMCAEWYVALALAAVLLARVRRRKAVP